MAERLADDMNALRPGSARPLVLDKKGVGGALEEADFVVHAVQPHVLPGQPDQHCRNRRRAH